MDGDRPCTDTFQFRNNSTEERQVAVATATVPRAPATVLALNPLTRVGGALGVHAETDGEQITDAHVAGTGFRGYEQILTGRDPRDCMMVASRSCGWCGGVHQTTASLALEMAWGLTAPPMAQALRTVAQATEMIWVHAAHLAVRAGPDYSADVVRHTTPWVWEEAVHTPAPGAAVHGYRTMADLMEALTPVTGSYWRETVQTGRKVLEMINLLYGKYPHPSVLSPGGVGTELTVGSFTEYYTRLYRAVDYVKKQIALWDDLVDFLADSDPRFAEQGQRPASFIHAGALDDPEFCDGSYANLDLYGSKRLAGPGVIIDGQQVTDRLSEVEAGVTESVARSFYAEADGVGDFQASDWPANHPRNRRTVPAPGERRDEGAYSWCTAPRWNGHVVESTPLGRLWLTALRGDFPPNEFIEPTGHSVRINVPENFLPLTTVEWRIPQRANMLERLRADAYGVAFAGLCAANGLLKGFELLRSYRTNLASGFKVAQGTAAGVGLWESGRGMTAHWLLTNKGRVENYQIVGASTWNASPRDAQGQPGPIEEALLGSPMLEQADDEGPQHGIDAARIVRSFDPCMNCAVH